MLRLSEVNTFDTKKQRHTYKEEFAWYVAGMEQAGGEVHGDEDIGRVELLRSECL